MVEVAVVEEVMVEEAAVEEVEVSLVEEVELVAGGDVLGGVGCCLVGVVELVVGGGVGVDGPDGGKVASSSCLQNPFTIDVADAMASA